MTTETTDVSAGQEPETGLGADYVSDRKFIDFPISEEVLKGIHELGYETATPVQAATIEVGITGKDLVVRAKTGTGKTTAFCLPMLERLEDGLGKAQAVILAPTRELAQQIAEECSGLAKYRDLNIATLVGGLPIGPQTKAIENGADIIVGTPGRILDHLGRKTLSLDAAKVICLDEADEMLSMGFVEDVTKIISACREDRQILLFSATISAETKRLVTRFCEGALEIQLSTDADNVDLIEHVIYETDPQVHKVRSLLFLLDNENPTSAIIFCNTREDAATVASYLDRQGLDAQLLSGELSQSRRSKVMKLVKSGAVKFLVSTDVASRGIDISDLSHVINYSLPKDASVYLHRAGRTGRIGKKGVCINLVGGTDLGTRNTLLNVHKIDFNLRTLPDAETAAQKRVDRQAQQIHNAMGKMVFESYLPTVRALKNRPDGDALLAAALRAFFQWDRERRAAVHDIDGPVRPPKNKGRGDSGDKRNKRGRNKKRREDAPKAEAPAPSLDDLDALLVEDSPPAEKPAKKRRRRRKRKPAASGESSGAAEKASSESSGPDLSDLDALLSEG